jgi:hypothetical protein
MTDVPVSSHLHAEGVIGQITDCLMPDGLLSVGIIPIGCCCLRLLTVICFAAQLEAGGYECFLRLWCAGVPALRSYPGSSHGSRRAERMKPVAA